MAGVLPGTVYLAICLYDIQKATEADPGDSWYEDSKKLEVLAVGYAAVF